MAIFCFGWFCIFLFIFFLKAGLLRRVGVDDVGVVAVVVVCDFNEGFDDNVDEVVVDDVENVDDVVVVAVNVASAIFGNICFIGSSL